MDYKTPKYRKYYPIVVEGMLREGKNKVDICRYLQIDEYALTVWRYKYPDFNESWIKGCSPIDYQVESSLLKCALGYTTTEVHIDEVMYKGAPYELRKTTIKEVAPSVNACTMWLTNRRPDKWKVKPMEEAVETKLMQLLDKLEGLNPKKKEIIINAEETNEFVQIDNAQTDVEEYNNNISTNQDGITDMTYEEFRENYPEVANNFSSTDYKSFLKFVVELEEEDNNPFNANDKMQGLYTEENNTTDIEPTKQFVLDVESLELDPESYEREDAEDDKDGQ